MITQDSSSWHKEYLSLVHAAVLGGVSMVQLRDKSSSLPAVRERALVLKRILRPLNVPLIINDHVLLAQEIDAEGVHIGQRDMRIEKARKILGPDKIIGVSIESFLELELCNSTCGINYVSASAVFSSSTKTDCKTIWRLDGLKKIVKQSSLPVIAIGGINSNNVARVIECGATGVAVHSALHTSNPFLSAVELNELIKKRTVAKI